jgi:hypothetical protein
VVNPVTKYEIRDFTPNDIAQVMENFFDLVSWATSEAVHVHHIQTIITDLPSVGASTSLNVTGLTWPTPFPASITPVVFAQQNEVGAGPSAGVVALNAYPYNISNTGCSVRLFNTTASVTTAVTNGLVVMAYDPNFNTSLS